MGAVIKAILLDTISDVAKIIPFLFVTYLVLEWMEHETGKKFEHFLEGHRKIAPLAGALFGIVPECGFSSAASSLYATGVISAGTLAAVYLSTSDEMLPLMISSHAPADKILPLLAVKVITAIIAGYLADLFSRHSNIDVESFCQREHCDCEHGVLHSAIMHTLTITIWLFVITLLLNGAVDLIGMDTLRAFVSRYPSRSVLVCTLIGMIPNCASSLLLTQMYLDQMIPFAAVAAGLLANAGVGMMVLFRVNPNMKNNFRIVGYVWAVSFVTGLILHLF
ncbi:MAG: putative manganese transporter [Lactimicrobium massiliense]|nr:putative manganese transporter [Lactimicrobium massiliense]MDD6231014.1 putative manganese transporter [Lactimicrobium massiliense]